MRDQFPGFYRPTSEQFETLWATGTIAVDANVLLNLYRYSSSTTEQLLNILRAVGDRLWVPHQAALEFHKNRLDVIQQRADMYGDLLKRIDDAHGMLLDAANRLKRHPQLDEDIIRKHATEMHSALRSYVVGQQGAAVDLLQGDVLDESLLHELSALLEGKVGRPLSAEELSSLYEQGRARFDAGRPPGHADAKSKSEPGRYGDLVLWEQVLRHAESTRRPVILVTDDDKEDWWWKHRGMAVGPRQELVEEIRGRAGVGFYLYRPPRFMEEAQQFLGQLVNVEAGAIAEAGRTRPMRRTLDLGSGSRTIVLEFAPDELCRMLDIEPHFLHVWTVAGLVGPSIASADDGRVYSYTDARLAGLAKKLLTERVPTPVVRDAIAHVRSEAPRRWYDVWLVIRRDGRVSIIEADEQTIDLLRSNSDVLTIVDLDELEAEMDVAIDLLDRPPTD